MATVSSSTTLWATASKEWVIQPKPKPGRKPKKDIAPVQPEEEQVDSKGRRVQNRAAQRAFRERKQSQLADLQARVQSYEQGEIERNVALQNIAKRLKEENEVLRRENALLKDKLAKVEQERDIPRDNERKRWRDDSPSSSIASTQRKKYKLDHDLDGPRFPHSYISSPQSMVSSPSSNSSSDTRFSSVPFDQPDNFVGFAHLNEDTPCVCRDVFQQTGVNDHKMEVTPIRSIVLGTPPPPEETSILDNLPPYQPPVPLRLRPRVATQLNSIFQISPPSQPRSAVANCFRRPILALPPCDDCPCPSGDAEPLQHPHQPVATPTPSLATSTEKIPTNDAWRRLKSHPNIAFTDLDMLADVVSRRSRCAGPRVELSPRPGSATPELQQPVLLTDPHAHFREKERARASSSPGHESAKCGQRRIREVETNAVRDALRLLDAKFSLPG
ncbi:hypothetical protein C8J57DRAFT_1269675 [Mycena rebaudengoi]|nr:hypothetical protein C8J57DRAFT_1269675 [Mycena rebaudengoi]